MADAGRRYRLLEVIGAGSFATVHRARDVQLDADVAVKILAENHSLNPEIRERFITEGRSLRRVGGRHAVAVHDIGENDHQQPYLVLELADRGTLQGRVESLRAGGWRATSADVLALARPLAAAVSAVHGSRLVHRDLSPGNLLLTGDGETPAASPAPSPSPSPSPMVAGSTAPAAPSAAASAAPSSVIAPGERLLVADLGMCKDLALSSGLTVAGGTDGFRPPEQSRPSVIDVRADIWAMSALVDWLIRDSVQPAALHRALERGLQEDPADRQPDATTWLAEVEAALTTADAESAAGTASSTPGSSAAPDSSDAPAAPHRVRRRALLVVALVLVLLAGLGVGSVLGLGGRVPSAVGDASLAIDGPEQVQVGEEAVFTAETAGVESWVWTLPSGSHRLDVEEVTLTASGAGTAEIVLRARTADGRDLEARRTVRVIE
ncbi:serine/threonine-protein kinase [Brachybacterium sp. DNPG3]